MASVRRNKQVGLGELASVGVARCVLPGASLGTVRANFAMSSPIPRSSVRSTSRLGASPGLHSNSMSDVFSLARNITHPEGDFMKSINFLAWIFASLLLATSVAHAQGVGSSGDIKGTVTDSTGGVLPKVTMVVVGTET